MPMTDNETISLFQALSAGMENVKPDQGGGGNWPANGTYECIVTELSLNAGDDVTFGAKESGMPGFIMQFKYLRLKDPNAAGGATPVNGEYYRFPKPSVDLSKLTAGQQQNLDILKQKLAGFIVAILGRNPSNNLGADILALQKKLATGKVVCEIRFNEKESGQYTNRDSYCVSCLSS